MTAPFIRITSKASADTSQTAYFRQIWRKVAPLHNHVMIDPFARNCTLAWPYTNDLNEDTEAKYHLDALEFLRCFNPGTVDFVIFDPPFSERQADEHYDGHANTYTVPGYISQCFKEIYRILKPGGRVLKFGYNSNRDHPTLDLVRGWIVALGGNRNDTIVTEWVKLQHSLPFVAALHGIFNEAAEQE